MNPKRLAVAISRFNKTLSGDSVARHLGMVARLTAKSNLDEELKNKIIGASRGSQLKLLLEIADELGSRVYPSASLHREAVQVAYLIKKYPWPSIEGVDPERAARKTFLQRERKCARMNTLLRKLEWSDTWERMRTFILKVLGPTPDIERVLRLADFPGGASMGVHGNATNVARKLRSAWTVTPGAYQIGYAAIMRHDQAALLLLPSREGPEDRVMYCYDGAAASRQYASKVRLVNNSKIAFVPKTAKTHRTIAVEPTLNGYLQKGVDLLMREKLRVNGLDLSRQEPNQELARKGSLEAMLGHEDPLCTMDLSSASDSISIELVRRLLPPDWFDLLWRLRSPSYTMNGRLHVFRKFCSMGNGFCFPLETLIFAAAAKACGAGRVNVDYRVYGDDIIVRQSVYDGLEGLLSEMGFDLNRDKSFRDGLFRESCGADWYAGEDVRPYVFDERLDSLLSLMKFWNYTSTKEHLRVFFSEERERALSLVPRELLFLSSDHHPDGPDVSFVVPHDVFMAGPYTWRSRDLWAWGYLTLKHLPVRDELDEGDPGYRVYLTYAALRGCESTRPFTVRRQTRIAVARRYCS